MSDQINNGLDALSSLIHETAIAKGFWEGPINHDKIGNKLALIHSEVTEVLEAIRKNKGSKEVVEEMADIIIRLLDLYSDMYIAGFVEHSLEEELNLKMEKNNMRQRLHGNLF